MLTQIGSGNAEAVVLTGEDKAVYCRARKALAPLGVPVDVAAMDYAKHRTQLGGDFFREAVEEFVRRRDTIKAATVPEVVEMFIEQKAKRTKRGTGASADYLKDLKSRLRCFSDAHQMPIGALTPDDVDRFLEGLGFSGRTRFNYARLLRTLFRFAQSKRMLVKDVDLMEGIDVEHKDTSAIEIFTPAELSRILTATRAEMIPFIAIGAFAGLRHAEIKRLDWADIDLTQGHIIVEAGKAKTGSRRIVPIQPNLKQWLTPHARPAGPVAPFANCAKQIIWLMEDVNRSEADAPKLDWRHNALRHSFVSYRFAVLKSADAVAVEARNSPQMIFGHYRELVTPDQAAAWFAITPKRAENIVTLERKAV